MRYALSVLLAAHGIAHLPGCLVPWRWWSSPDLPFKTTLLAGRVDVGDVGIRIVGLVWLTTAVLMITVAVGMARQARWAEALVPLPILASFVLCVLELPHARIGLALNAVLLLLLAGHPTVGAGAMRWVRVSDDERGRLTASQASHPVRQFSLIPPLDRFFARVMPEGPAGFRVVELTQAGEFRMGARADGWRPFTATQLFTVERPGFVWDARIAAMPLLPVFVRDTFIAGRGGMVASVGGLYTVLHAAPSADLDAGALQRYLAEAVWFPEALLPSGALTWEPVDDHSARATLVDGGTRVALRFEFNETGDVVRVSTPGRMREVEGRYEPTPWSVRCSEHALHAGVLIPTYCEVSWDLPDGPLTYWKGRMTGYAPRQ